MTLEALSALPDSWTVLWNIPVGIFGRPRPGLRQIDFLLIHARLGLIVLEVKGGEISIEEGTWYTKPHGGERTPLGRSPFDQVADARYQLSRFLDGHCKLPRTVFSHGVVLPDCSVDGPLGPDAPRELVLDESDLSRPREALQRVTAAWGVTAHLDEETIEQIIGLLKPSRELTIVLATRAAQTELSLERETRRQVELVESQIEAYEELLRSNRAVVLGGAGTGKTVIAVERARRLAAAQQRTLLLCHRASVATFMNTLLDQPTDQRAYDPLRPLPSDERPYDSSLPPLLHVASWSGLLRGLAEARDIKMPTHKSPTLPDWFLQASDDLSLQYDAIVVDEGQEFTPRQFEALSWLLDDPEAGALYVFADPFQHSGLYTESSLVDRRRLRGQYQWIPPIEGSLLRLTHNCRNSVEIASLAESFYPLTAPRATVSGVPPEFLLAGDRDSLIDAVVARVRLLLTHHQFSPNQVLVTLVGIDPGEFAKAARRADVLTVTATGLARFPLTPIDVRVAIGSPDEVQGLEAEVVVVAYWQPQDAGVDTVRDVYVAATRARSVLTIISNVDQSTMVTTAREALLAAGRSELPNG